MFIRLLVATLAATGCGRAVVDNGTQLTTLVNHTPAIVKGAHVTGHVDPQTTLRLRVAMPLRDEGDLDTLLTNLYDPQSSAYQTYLTPADFQAAYHPTGATVARVRAALLAAGMDADSEAQGTLLGVNATATQAEAFFHTQLATYQDANGVTFYAPAESVSVSAGLPINAVFGLHTTFPAHSGLKRLPTTMLDDNPRMSANDIRAAYNIPASATGVDQVVGLYELDAYDAADIQGYAQENNIPLAPLTNILVDNFPGTVQSTHAQSEVTLDIELVNALVPNANIRVYETFNNGSGLDLYNEIANPTLGDKRLVSVVSTSWASPEQQSSTAELQSEGAIFKQMAAQGQTLLAASGDSGANADGTNLGVNDPPSQPFVVAAGGTTLTLNNSTYGGETAWSGSGGGISTAWPIPAWQTAAVGSDSQASSTMRNVPDVALDADPSSGYSIFVNGKSQAGVGGTSCAAPLWAGMVGLVNEARGRVGLGPIGFLSPALYFIGGSTQYHTAFHDIQGGNNGTYNAVAGFDDATGWGSFDGNNFIQVFSSGYGRSTFGAPPGLTPTNP